MAFVVPLIIILKGIEKQAKDIPDGGSANKLSVTAYGQEFLIPSYVAGEERAKDAKALYEFIEGLVIQACSAGRVWQMLGGCRAF